MPERPSKTAREKLKLKMERVATLTVRDRILEALDLWDFTQEIARRTRRPKSS